MKKSKILVAGAVLVLISANFAVFPVSGEEKKDAPPASSETAKKKSAVNDTPQKASQSAKPAVKKSPAKMEEPPLVIPHPLPTDPAENSKLAKKLLQYAEDTMNGKYNIRTYITITDNKEDGNLRSITKAYVKNNPDGTRWERNDQYLINRDDLKKARKFSFLTNDCGDWEIIGDVAVKVSYFTKIKNEISEKNIDEKNSYSVSKNSSDKFLKIIRKNTTTSDITEYSINPSNFFIYRTADYDANGKKVFETRYDRVEINTPIDKTIFEIPQHFKIIEAKTKEEHIDIPAQLMADTCEQYVSWEEINDLLKKLNEPKEEK